MLPPGWQRKTPPPVTRTSRRQSWISYLHNNSYGMKIASVQSIDQNGNLATVVCKMQEVVITVPCSFYTSNLERC